MEYLRELEKALPEIEAASSKIRSYDQFYSHPVIYKMNKKGQYIIRKLFKAFCDDPKLLPKHHKEKITDPHRPYRIACDYIAGMTDTFAIKEYNSIY